MNDLRERLRLEALAVSPPEDWRAEVERRMVRRRRRRQVQVAVIVLALAGGALAVSARAFRDQIRLVPVEEPGAANYVFRNVDLLEAQPPTAAISFQLGWSSDTWPGIHRCTWTAYAADGSVAGSFSRAFFHMEPVDDPGDAVQEVAIDRRATRASAGCDADRLDIGNPYAYEFDVIDVQADQQGSSVFWNIELDMRWLGEGHPGVVDCQVSITSADEVVYSKELPITRHFETIGLTGPGPAPRGPYGAEFDCRPHEGQEPYSPSTTTAPTAEEVVNGVSCHSDASLESGFVLMLPSDGRPPVDLCAQGWARNEFGTEEVPRGEPLVACVPPEREAVWVLPGTPDLCGRLGLFELPSGYEEAARAFARMRDEMIARFPEPGENCLSERTARVVARRILDSHGYEDWRIEEGLGEAGEGFSQQRPCADLAFSAARRVLTLVPSSLPPDA